MAGCFVIAIDKRKTELYDIQLGFSFCLNKEIPDHEMAREHGMLKGEALKRDPRAAPLAAGGTPRSYLPITLAAMPAASSL